MDWCAYTYTFCLCQGITYNLVVDWTFKKLGGGGGGGGGHKHLPLPWYDL